MLAALAPLAAAQAPTATPRPFTGFATPAPQNAPPPRDTPLVEKAWDALSNQEPGKDGKMGLHRFRVHLNSMIWLRVNRKS